MINDILSSPDLSVAFQPVVDLLSARIVGWEVFGRAPRHLAAFPDYTPPGPEELIELARRECRLAELEFAWRSIALDRIARSRRPADALYFFNVDTRIVDDPGYESGVTARLVMGRGLCPARFVLEFTQRGPTDTACVATLAKHYQGQGFFLAIDDFGSGRSQATDWWKLGPAFLKLNRQVVRGLGTDPMQQALVRVIVDAATRNHVRVIAEGIETISELRAAISAGVTFAQGFCLGRPEPYPMPLSHNVRHTVLREAESVLRASLVTPMLPECNIGSVALIADSA